MSAQKRNTKYVTINYSYYRTLLRAYKRQDALRKLIRSANLLLKKTGVDKEENIFKEN
jgi:hypothetical protein